MSCPMVGKQLAVSARMNKKGAEPQQGKGRGGSGGKPATTPHVLGFVVYNPGPSLVARIGFRTNPITARVLCLEAGRCIQLSSSISTSGTADSETKPEEILFTVLVPTRLVSIGLAFPMSFSKKPLHPAA